jgi:hypothetical protein
VEGEEGQSEGNPEGVLSHGDRDSLELPGEQEALLKAVAATGTPVVLVLLNGSALAVNWANEHIPAILEAWYPGQAGGRAIAEALFGDTNPGGKLPVTFYRSAEQLPPFEDYRMAGRTYRYFEGDVLYPFGFGLSYTRFSYQNLCVSPDRLYTPEVLQAYTAAFHPSFIALRGDLVRTKETAEHFKVFYRRVPTAGSYTMDHTAISYAFDAEGKLRLAFRPEMSAREVADDVAVLLKSVPAAASR